MRLGLGLASASLGVAFLIGAHSAALAGDDGAAPLWEGIGTIFGWGGSKEAPRIDYREHGKIVVPPTTDLPPPGSSASAAADPAWPVNQEVARKKAQKDAEAKQRQIAGVGDARLRYSHPFPNEPVTVRAVDPEGNEVKCPSGSCGTESSGLSSFNPLNWVGLGGKSATLGPEPDREWLTDPPKGFREPVEPTPAASPKPQSSAAN
jgi:hypothetical protein